VIVAATAEDIRHVCGHLREDDRREVMLTRWSDDTGDLAENILALRSGKYAARRNGRAVAVFGVEPVTPGVGQGWLVGTDEIGACGIEVAHACRRIVRTLFATGVHRIHAFSADFHHEAHAWLEAIGARREATLHAWGKDGTDFFCYAVTR
jgi:RimJ/RimL family protein N-acetyltransferase